MRQGEPSFFIALQIRWTPDPNRVLFPTSSSAGGAVFRPPHGFVRFCIFRFFDGRHVSRVKNSSDILSHLDL
jgi:hypothetical protein